MFLQFTGDDYHKSTYASLFTKRPEDTKKRTIFHEVRAEALCNIYIYEDYRMKTACFHGSRKMCCLKITTVHLKQVVIYFANVFSKARAKKISLITVFIT